MVNLSIVLGVCAKAESDVSRIICPSSSSSSSSTQLRVKVFIPVQSSSLARHLESDIAAPRASQFVRQSLTLDISQMPQELYLAALRSAETNVFVFGLRARSRHSTYETPQLRTDAVHHTLLYSTSPYIYTKPLLPASSPGLHARMMRGKHSMRA